MIDTKSWTKEAMYQKVLEHQMQGVIFHNDMMLFNAFCSLDCYSKKHKEQTKEEQEKFEETQLYYLQNYGKILETPKFEKIQVVSKQQEVMRYTPDQVTIEYRKNFLKETFQNWKKWEESTMELYLACMHYTLEHQCMDYIKFQELYKDTFKEYKYILKEIEKLQKINYDAKLL